MGTVIVGVDRSETAHRAARAAAELAKALGDGLHLVTAVPKATGRDMRAGTDTWHVDVVSESEGFLAELARRTYGPGATWTVLIGDPGSVVCSEAERLGATYVVVGNRRTHGAGRALGSVAGAVARHAHCHVVVANTTRALPDEPSEPASNTANARTRSRA